MSTPVVELESLSLLERFGSDRPVFHGRVSRALRRPRFFQVFGCKTGFLCLELTNTQSDDSDLAAFARWLAAIWFGPVAIIGYYFLRRSSVKQKASLDLSSTLLSDDEIVELARVRKRSFVARYDDIQSARIDPPDALERFFCGEKYQGTITFREKTVGKVTIQIYDRQCMETAIDAFSSRLPEIADIRAKFDPRRQRFIAQR